MVSATLVGNSFTRTGCAGREIADGQFGKMADCKVLVAALLARLERLTKVPPVSLIALGRSPT